MHYYEVAPSTIIRASSVTFTYASDTPLSIGKIVTVELGKKKTVGVVIKEVTKPNYETKHITDIIENTPLPKSLVEVSLWMSNYYVSHLATVLQTVLPRGIQKQRRVLHKTPHLTTRERTKNVFNKAQADAFNTFVAMSPGSGLLHGVTGSGKTAVYIELAKHTVNEGRSVIVLVPEIALTSQLVDEFSHHFNDIILVHSRQTESQRHSAWREALTSEVPRIVIGPRSAIFSPLANVGLIIIDEAHEPSFKQEQAPRYSALRVASVLARHHEAKVILGTATPNIADYYLFEHSQRPIVTMAQRARTEAVQPDITLIDMTKRTHFKRHLFFSDQLLAHIEESLSNGNQSLIFHNRRGSASMTLCEDCGWSAVCPRCFVPLTLHADTHKLECHICGLQERVPTSCPECGSVHILHKGIGTKLIESELKKIFPKASIARFDGDNTTGQSVEERYKELYDGKIDIIVGTQVIAKGLDLPKLRTVGVIQADAGLSLPDYSASERTFQLLTQVIGRVGRSHHSTNVVVQSYQPSQPAITHGLVQDYAHFYSTALALRHKGGFPPFSYLLKLTCVYKTEAAAIRNAQMLSRVLRDKLPKTVQILGPTPAFYERQHDTYRWQLVLKSPKRKDLVEALAYLPTSHWQSELDPVSLL